MAYLVTQQYPIVIKADGLALGKGVVIAEDLETATATLDSMMTDQKHGAAGTTVVIEEFLTGREISIHAFCDGKNFSLFPTAKDHKRAYEADKGPNTGGMGTITPVPGVSNEDVTEIADKIVRPIMAALAERGRPFVGVLYPGIMLTADGPKVIEFNARFGDPEVQSYVHLLETDLVDVLLACIEGRLRESNITWKAETAVCIVAASGGYPGTYKTGFIIEGLETVGESGVEVFHASTKRANNHVATNGGRVLNVTATAPTLKEALQKAYRVLEHISYEGKEYRRDIGGKSIE